MRASSSSASSRVLQDFHCCVPFTRADTTHALPRRRMLVCLPSVVLFSPDRLTSERRATGNSNVSYLDDAVVNARLARADRLTGSARERAFGRIAADLARNQAPMAVFSQPYQAEFVSKRLGCLTEQPVFGGLDLAALCLRKKA
jgi:hypothetical protein